MSISSVLLSAIIKVSATKALSAMRLCPSLAYRILLFSIFTHMCKFCTCGISRQFTFVVYVPNMPLNNSPVSLEKRGHLFRTKPYRFVLKFDIDIGSAVGSLV